MRDSVKGRAIQELGQLFRRGTAPAGDGDLLDRFLADRSESAFETIVDRHGPMVLGVCRRILTRSQDADDAFQATFLVLLRKAGQLRDPDRLGPWLYGVATRVAIKARSRAARIRHEPLPDLPAAEGARSDWPDVRPILDAELARLPARHREVLVLCLLLGASAEEASDRLGCPVGTVKSRLARGRENLRARLVRRGIAPGLAALPAPEALSSPVPAPLIRSTLALTGPGAVGPGVEALSKGLESLMFSKPSLAAALILGGITAAGLGAANWLTPTLAQAPNPRQQPQAQPERGRVERFNLRSIILAFHNYNAAHDRFPAASILGSDGRPNLSWRVAVLPYLGQGDLYNAFRQDEPWDSPHNKALIARMPAVFQTPEAPAPAGETRIRGFAGPGTMFDGNQGTTIASITDGTSNTLLLALASEPTTWTKPGELPFLGGQPLPTLEAIGPEGFMIGIVDGQVRDWPKDQIRLLPSVITRSGGEVITWPGAIDDGSPVIVPGSAMPTPLPPTGPGGFPGGGPGLAGGAGPGVVGPEDLRAMGERLQRVEEKLDRILKKLNAGSLGP